MSKPGVYITKEQDIAIRYLANVGWANQAILRFKIGAEDGQENTNYKGEEKNALLILKRMNFDSLAIALYDSYEVEKTPEEKLSEYFHRLDNDTADDSKLIAKGIYETVKILGLKVEGIN